MTTEFGPYHQNYDESILGSTYPPGAAPAPAPAAAFVAQHRQLDDIPPLEKEVVSPSAKPFWRTRKGKWIIAIVTLAVITVAVAIGVGLGVSGKSTRTATTEQKVPVSGSRLPPTPASAR